MQRVAIELLRGRAAAPRAGAVAFLQRAKQAKEIAVEDLRDAFAVSYETAAHRFTNLATHHLDIRTSRRATRAGSSTRRTRTTA